MATLALLGPLGWLWQASLLPASYSVMDMGYLDEGGRPSEGGHAGHGAGSGRDVTSLTEAERARRAGADAASGPADVEVTLVARKGEFRLADGRAVDGYTLNGTSPGPVIHAVQGQVVQVQLVNESVPDGATLHWHGVHVPNAEDGVAGVTQDAVPVGGEHVYRFRAEQVGTFWYHSHQMSHIQVLGGLLGALVITPPNGGDATDDLATLALVHIYDGRRTVNGWSGDLPVDTAPGSRMRVRVINTDNGPMPVWVGGAPYRVLAVDGTDLHEPTPVADTGVLVTAGGRADLEIVMPTDGAGVRVELGGSAAVALGRASAPVSRPEQMLDLLSYGSPAPVGFDPAVANRRFDYAIGRWPGFIDGVPGIWWTINGHLFPDVPMYVVAEGDVVRMRVSNSSGEVHPMHLHGHHALVLRRNGMAATGSPWWVDSLNVADGETYEIAFRADNPGLWMDHCHHLVHAAEGLVAHLMYEGVTTPFRVGGPAANHPE
ncbi:MAG: multicopper oxidase family protein [Pseudonocardia sp.]